MSHITTSATLVESLPERCTVLVVGAGPAGSACARKLAQAGHDVLMVDAQAFPRDKTCGDGLIPDTFAALEKLGLRETVVSNMSAVTHAHCQGPRGGALLIPSDLGVMRRKEFDQLLFEGACEAGATVRTRWKLVALESRDSDGRIVGARFKQGDLEQRVQADWVVLATGAALDPLVMSGMCTRRAPSAMALRAYVHCEGVDANEAHMHFVWHPALSPGYGWIFPVGNGRYNVGVGVDGLHQASKDGRAAKQGAVNLRALFERFCDVHPTARYLKEHGQWESDLKGAPMRCDLAGAEWARPGLLLAGEAAGSTYAFTGEGIGKALETGMAAAEAIGHTEAGSQAPLGSDEQVMKRYRLALEALLPRYRMYRKAHQFNRWPWMIDLVIWRSQRSQRLIGLMGDVLAERRMPDTLLSWRGIKRLILG